MKKAADIARQAYQQALVAAAAERERQEAEAAEELRLKRQRHQETFEEALPILAKWFPGVMWQWHQKGDYGFDTILTDGSEGSPSFMLRATRRLIDMNDPKAGYRIKIEVGDYQQDTSMSGHSYFAGGEIKSAADLGRYLERKIDAC